MMSDYRRYRVPGGTYFFTINLLERRSDLLTRHIDVLREAVRRTRLERPFFIDAWVVLPEHMRCLITLPEGATATFRTVSRPSRFASFVTFRPPRGVPGHGSPAASGASGNAVFGSIPSATTPTTSGAGTMSTTNQRNWAMSPLPATGCQVGLEMSAMRPGPMYVG